MKLNPIIILILFMRCTPHGYYSKMNQNSIKYSVNTTSKDKNTPNLFEFDVEWDVNATTFQVLNTKVIWIGVDGFSRDTMKLISSKVEKSNNRLNIRIKYSKDGLHDLKTFKVPFNTKSDTLKLGRRISF